ncbi:MAG TPA: tyrosine-protein phosphatase [Vitreimonas sp.]|nr:tyrosine-protein phosphatase [Vitreimonas sp.]
MIPDLSDPPLAPASDPVRHLRLPGTRNLRDVGGYPAGAGRRTRWRTLLRTDALDRLPPASQAALLDLGLRQVIDLRWPHELDEAPSVFRAAEQVTYRSIPLLEDDPTPYAGLAGTYRHMLDARAPQLVETVRALLEPAGLPAVIGCAAGKDRTGVAVALVLAAVGVPPEVVVDDYVLSAAAFRFPVADDHLTDWRAQPVDVECPPEHMLGALEHLERRHGGAAQLLRRNGLTEAELERLVDRLTEPCHPAGRVAST